MCHYICTIRTYLLICTFVLSSSFVLFVYSLFVVRCLLFLINFKCNRINGKMGGRVWMLWSHFSHFTQSVDRRWRREWFCRLWCRCLFHTHAHPAHVHPKNLTYNWWNQNWTMEIEIKSEFGISVRSILDHLFFNSHSFLSSLIALYAWHSVWVYIHNIRTYRLTLAG